jgi:hypothetical protein
VAVRGIQEYIVDLSGKSIDWSSFLIQSYRVLMAAVDVSRCVDIVPNVADLKNPESRSSIRAPNFPGRNDSR